MGRDRIPAPNDMTTDLDDDAPPTLGPFGTAAPTYYRAGWPVFPVVGKAINIPRGITGRAGVAIEYSTVVDWMFNRPDDNIAVRLVGIIGIDIDAYDKDGQVKRGDETLASAEHLWGPLPPTWCSTSREPGNPSGIRFYRVPKGMEFRTILALPNMDGEVTGDIEICQQSHRYAVVWPSVHPDTATVYRWYTPDGVVAIDPPDALALPALPQRWIDELTLIRPTVDERPPAPVTAQLALPADWHPKVTEHYQDGLDAVGGPAGSRHDNTLQVVGRLARDESRARAGATTALGLLRERFVAAIGDDRQRDPAREFESMVEGSRELVATTVSTAEAERDAVLAVFANAPLAPVVEASAVAAERVAVARKRLAPISARDLADWVDSTPPPEWLISNFLAAGGDDYGVIAAEPKVGKTWVVGDLAVAVAAGQPWMSHYPTKAGPVLVYVGEGGKRTAERRFQAIAHHYGHDFGDLPIWIVEGVPHLSVAEDEAIFHESVAEIQPVLTFIDPLYLAARGSDSRQLVEMGAVLETAQRVCQTHSSALLFAHHWNRSGTGTGGGRSTGAGPWEWARVSLSMRTDGEPTRTQQGERLTVQQRLVVEVEGGNVIPTTLRLARTIESTPGSLTAPLRYDLEAQPEGAYAAEAAEEDGKEIRARVLAVVATHPKRCTLGDLYAPGGPFHVGGRGRVEPVVKTMLNAGELVAIRWRHPETDRSADRLDLLTAGGQLASTLSEEHTP